MGGREGILGVTCHGLVYLDAARPVGQNQMGVKIVVI
jgi:hypothetical protein